MNVETIVVEGCRLAQRRMGKGPPLLLLHGMAGCDWPDELLTPLAAHFELIIPDHPGFGGSGTPDWLRSIDDLAYFYLSFMKKSSLPHVSILAHSFGGWVAAEMAIRNPDVVKSMVLVAPAGLRKKGEIVGDIFLWNREELSRNLVYDDALAKKRLARNFTKEELEIQLKNRYSGARLSWEPRLSNPTLARWVHRIECPVTLVWGDSDKVVPPSYADVWLQKLPNAKSSVIKNCGHLVQIEKPTELAAIILGGTGK
jgi:pimeloyl-ACP methyl ester carboxylesterase